MKVLNLACGDQHGFEGWFASEDAFQSQLQRGLLECPVCGSASVRKLPSAPRLNLGAADATPATRASDEASAPEAQRGESGGPPDAAAGRVPALAPDGPLPLPAAVQARALRAMREWVARTENVGERFADEARRIHHGEAPRRDIRGQASAKQAAELIEEGIAVLPMPDLGPALKETLQ